MSSLLHRLGTTCARHAKTVLGIWLAVVILLCAAVASVGLNLDNSFTLEGSESIEGMKILQEQLPEAAGTNGQIVYEATDNSSLAKHETEIKNFIKKSTQIPGITYIADPFDKPELWISKDGKFAISQTQIADLTDAATAGPGLHKNGETLDAIKIHLSKDLIEVPGVPISGVEIIGVILALIILLITFRSMIAAGLPILSALVGVGTGIAAILLIATYTDVSSTAPTLAVMLGLAVGIDYSLLILSRHRDHLKDGVPPVKAAGRALATAGSAVIFAGVTVIIALLGMFVVNIHFLTVMGAVAALTVGCAVLVAITLIPALAGLLGQRLIPRTRAGKSTSKTAHTHALAHKWSELIIGKPILAILGSVIIAALLTTPISALRLALPDAGYEPPASEGRQTYELIDKEFGQGYNSPIAVIGDLITSITPLEDAEKLGAELGKIPGVEKVAIATPDRKASIAFAQLIPKYSQADPRTTELVNQIRAQRSDLETVSHVGNLKVTGLTAVAIDVSASLSGALLPFGILVVGLSLILLTIVFRSLIVPVTATLGYLISLGAAMGVTGAVFGWGWGAQVLNVDRTGPVISFMPIIVMGILFGLAMDYQVFLVSRMREAHVHGASPDQSIREAFRGAGKVIAAAALIMIGVFAFFIPEGGVYVRPMAVALTVGIAVDAFIVRMTLIPAVMKLLGEGAWWLPRWLDRALPEVDIEGAGLETAISNAHWHEQHLDTTIRIEKLWIEQKTQPLFHDYSLTVGPGINLLVEPDALRRSALVAALQGRIRPESGLISVLGKVLPDRGRAIAERVVQWEAEQPTEWTQAEVVLADEPELQFWEQLEQAEPLQDHQTVLVTVSHTDQIPPGIQPQITELHPTENTLGSEPRQGENS